MFKLKKMMVKKADRIVYFKIHGKRYFGTSYVVVEVEEGDFHDKMAEEFIPEKHMLKEGEGFSFNTYTETTDFMLKSVVKELADKIRYGSEEEELEFTNIIECVEMYGHKDVELMVFKYASIYLNSKDLGGEYIYLDRGILPIDAKDFKNYKIYYDGNRGVIFKPNNGDDKSFIAIRFARKSRNSTLRPSDMD